MWAVAVAGPMAQFIPQKSHIFNIWWTSTAVISKTHHPFSYTLRLFWRPGLMDGLGSVYGFQNWIELRIRHKMSERRWSLNSRKMSDEFGLSRLLKESEMWHHLFLRPAPGSVRYLKSVLMYLLPRMERSRRPRLGLRSQDAVTTTSDICNMPNVVSNKWEGVVFNISANLWRLISSLFKSLTMTS